MAKANITDRVQVSQLMIGWSNNLLINMKYVMHIVVKNLSEGSSGIVQESFVQSNLYNVAILQVLDKLKQGDIHLWKFGNIKLEYFTPPSVQYSHNFLIFKGQEACLYLNRLPGRIMYLRLPSPYTFNDSLPWLVAYLPVL